MPGYCFGGQPGRGVGVCLGFWFGSFLLVCLLIGLCVACLGATDGGGALGVVVLSHSQHRARHPPPAPVPSTPLANPHPPTQILPRNPQLNSYPLHYCGCAARVCDAACGATLNIKATLPTTKNNPNPNPNPPPKGGHPHVHSRGEGHRVLHDRVLPGRAQGGVLPLREAGGGWFLG